jgi:hypothetical protein
MFPGTCQEATKTLEMKLRTRPVLHSKRPDSTPLTSIFAHVFDRRSLKQRQHCALRRPSFRQTPACSHRPSGIFHRDYQISLAGSLRKTWLRSLAFARALMRSGW